MTEGSDEVWRSRARELRNAATDAERAIWQRLRRRRFSGFKFRRQHPIGTYVVDFVCLERRLVIEVDGAQHADQHAYDEARSEWLRERGYQVLRFTDREVLMEIMAVEEAIWVALGDASGDPPP